MKVMKMKIFDLLNFSLYSLCRRKGRTLLTVIGVVIGTCAVVVMVSLGIAVNNATDKMLTDWGDLTKIEVYNYSSRYDALALDDSVIEQFKNLENVVAATPMIQLSEFEGKLVAGNRDQYETNGLWNIVGMDADAVASMGYKLKSGSPLSGSMIGSKKIAVLASELAVFEFFDNTKSEKSSQFQRYPYDDMGNVDLDNAFFDISNEKISLQMIYGYDEQGQPKTVDYELVITGVFVSDDNDMLLSRGYIMDMADMKRLEADYKKMSDLSEDSGGNSADNAGVSGNQTVGYNMVYVKVDDINRVTEVEDKIKDMGYECYSMGQIRQEMQSQVLQSQMMLGGLAAVSLLVAALNIANTMTMSIYERTREIGIMKVLGCRLWNIRAMFLIESGMIGFIGGFMGNSLGILVGMLLNYLPGWLSKNGIEGGFDISTIFGMGNILEQMPDMQISVIQPWLIVLALCFSTMMGVLSGIAPANRAMKISSLEAIRHE